LIISCEKQIPQRCSLNDTDESYHICGAKVHQPVRSINWRSAKIAVIAVIIIVSAASLQGYYSEVTTRTIKGQAQDAFKFVVNNTQSGDIVILDPGFNKYPFDYYQKTPNIDVKPFPAVQYYAMSWTFSREELIKELQSDVNGHNRVWFVSSDPASTAEVDRLDLAMKTLNQSYENTYSASYTLYTVQLFEKRN
jgi:hypothetical protein